MRQLENRVAIVTGGGRGIGKATAELFAAHGAKVVVATRTEAPGRETVEAIAAAGGEASLTVIDVGDREAVRTMVADTAQRYGRIDITVNGVEPGLTQTHSLETSMTPEQIASTAARLPSGRAARPEEIAGAFLFLASDAGSYVTGRTIVMDGGSTLGDVAGLPLDRA